MIDVIEYVDKIVILKIGREIYKNNTFAFMARSVYGYQF